MIIALHNNKAGIVEFLLNNLADTTLKDDYEKNFFDYLKESKNEKMNQVVNNYQQKISNALLRVLLFIPGEICSLISQY